MSEPIVLVGGGGHCLACIDVIESSGNKIAGIIDKEVSIKMNDYRVLGNDDSIGDLIKGHSFLITVGFIKNPEPRILLYEKIKALGGRFSTIVSPHALLAKQSSIGEGTIIMHHALVNAYAKIGNNCIINNKALIEHGSVIGDHTHISTGAVVNGDCMIGNAVFIGSNTVIGQGIHIADKVIVGAGSVVVKNISEAGVYAGNPAKKISGGK
jgi:sugar O-acyltransferase (sialic acid O-acetyltransferase NeuD family)